MSKRKPKAFDPSTGAPPPQPDFHAIASGVAHTVLKAEELCSSIKETHSKVCSGKWDPAARLLSLHLLDCIEEAEKLKQRLARIEAAVG